MGPRNLRPWKFSKHEESAVDYTEHHDVLALLQARVISRLFCGKVHDLVLKGGMAMRVAHEHARHTKDIDLDADHDLPLESVQRLVRRAIQDATRDGLLEDVVVSEPKQTHTTARWKINGRVPETGLPLHLTVEVSFREHTDGHQVRWVPFQPDARTTATPVPVYTDDRLVINKINALLSPTRNAPRDVVDLFLLFQAGVELTEESIAQLHLEELGETQACQAIWDKLEAMDQAQFEQQVLPVWQFPGERPAWVDWERMRLAVGERVEQLLHQRCASGSCKRSHP